jgi:hypothetical protein
MNKNRLWQMGSLIVMLLAISGITCHFISSKNNNHADSGTIVVPVTNRQ